MVHLKTHVHSRCIARPVLQKKKKHFANENRCLQCVESIFVNLPQFAKSGLKESLNRLFGIFLYISFWIFWSGTECFCECLFHCSTFDGRRRGSPKYNRLRDSIFLISEEMGKKLLAANSTDSLFAEFLLHRMFNCKQRSR